MPTQRRIAILTSHATIVVAATALFASIALPASAHVSLTLTQIPADTAMTLAFRAPVEREGTTNAKLESFAPGEFEITGCKNLTGWTCDVEEVDGGTVIVWDAITVGTTNDIRFEFDVVTPSKLGSYKFPTIQTYSDGHEAEWIADGEPNPAPRVEVVGDGVAEPEPTEAPEPTHAATTPPPATTGSDPEPSSAAADPGLTQSDAPDAGTGEPTEVETDGPAVPATDVPSRPSEEDSAGSEVDDLATSAGEGEGGSPLPLILGLMVVLGVGGWFVWSRQASAG